MTCVFEQFEVYFYSIALTSNEMKTFKMRKRIYKQLPQIAQFPINKKNILIVMCLLVFIQMIDLISSGCVERGSSVFKSLKFL